MEDRYGAVRQVGTRNELPSPQRQRRFLRASKSMSPRGRMWFVAGARRFEVPFTAGNGATKALILGKCVNCRNALGLLYCVGGAICRMAITISSGGCR